MARYKIVETSTREQWLEARQKVLTATEIAAIHVGGPGEPARIRESKKHPPEEIHSKYFAWGHKREPSINNYAKALVDSRLEPNDKLLISTLNPRVGATPDQLGGEVIGEDKTSKKQMLLMDAGLDLEDPLALRYYMQMQVQLFVTGAEVCVFTWEQHDDDWQDRGGEYLEPQPIRIDHQLVYPDREAWRVIGEIVTKYFDQEDEVDEVRQAIITDKLNELRSIREQQDDLKQQESKLLDSIKEQLGNEDASIKVPGASVSYFLPKASSRFDATASKKAHPELAGEYMKKSAPKGRTLRITFKEDDV